MNRRAKQAQAEWNAGYRAGANGEPMPSKDKGAAYFGGWLAGRAEQEDIDAKRGME